MSREELASKGLQMELNQIRSENEKRRLVLDAERAAEFSTQAAREADETKKMGRTVSKKDLAGERGVERGPEQGGTLGGERGGWGRPS